MNQERPPTPPAPKPLADPRKERLAAALRDNLKRRKVQGRARKTAEKAEGPGSKATE